MYLKRVKKVVAGALCAAMLVTQLPLFNVMADTNVTATGEVSARRPYRELTAEEIVAEMGTGWNLGNTMDGHTGFTPGETVWQSVETTQKLIDAVHDYGFNTVRVPVTWGTMIDDENGYTIDEAWISRVQDIVDYCISQDMYVIVNIHHDGAEQTGWLRIASDNPDAVEEKFVAVWKQIAERFKDYDEHLVFESMNEVTGEDGSTEGIIHDMNMIMRLNQAFVDTVRVTGSNNEVRWLSVPGRYTNISVTTDERYGFKMPEDSVENRLFLSVHYYDWQFGIMETMGRKTFSYQNVTELDKEFNKLHENFIDKGVPVIVGEYGCVNKNNLTEREYHVEAVNRICAKHGLTVPVLWDQGWYDRTREPADYSFTAVDRATTELVDAEYVHAIMRGMFTDGADDYSDITKGTEVVNITDAAFDKEQLTLTIGDTEKIEAVLSPDNTNDVLLWSTSDRTVATVYNGNVIARGAGSAVLTARSQSGSFEKQITVIVNAAEKLSPCTEITYTDEIELIKGAYGYYVATADNGEYVSYKSSNPNVATVSTVGKIVAKETGETYITVTAESGMTKVTKVTVKEQEASTEVSVALNVYYNDSTHEYYSNEYGSPIVLTGNGQYTVAFDCATDLSDAAKAAGVTGLANLTAVYIKDYSVTTGVAKRTPLSSCNIMFDKVVVDGTELTVTQTEPKSALKTSKILDTNDPLNAWDGSQVEEVEVNTTNHSLCIAGMENPQKIEVTFTISDMVAKTEEAAGAASAISAMTTDTESITFNASGEMKEIVVNVEPADAKGIIAFASSDTAYAMVSGTAEIKDGKAVVTVVSGMEGEAVITAYAQGGTTLEIKTNTAIPTPVPTETPVAAATEIPEATATQEPEKEPTKAAEITETPDEDSKDDNTDKDEDSGKEDTSEEGMSLTTGIIIAVVVIVVIAAVVIVVLKRKKNNSSNANNDETDK